jgi:hypothetical protein
MGHARQTVYVSWTELGRIGMIICFGGDCPERSRVQAVLGAEVICRPLGGCCAVSICERSRRGLASTTTTGTSWVSTRSTKRVSTSWARASGRPLDTWSLALVRTRDGATARLDPADALYALTPGSSARQGFDHLAGRNRDLIRRYRGEFAASAAEAFPPMTPRWQICTDLHRTMGTLC